MNFHEDDRLIEKVQSGDEEAFNLLYDKYYKPMLYTAYRLTNNMEDAKDAVQAAFFQMYKSIGNLKDPKYFRLWMNKIVRGKCIDIFHKNRDVIIDIGSEETINEFQEGHRDYIPHEQLKFTADKEILMHLIEKLPFHYRGILIDAYFLQFSMKEIAELLELPIGAVKSRLYAAKKALRSEVVNYETDHHHKLTFRLPGVLPCALLLAFSREAKNWNMKNKQTFTTKGKAVALGVSAFVLSGVLLAPAVREFVYHSSDTKMEALPQSVSPNCQQAYFILKNWAGDDVQMSEKTETEIQAIQPIYEYLKESQGPYWERLVNDQWNRAFEALAEK